MNALLVALIIAGGPKWVAVKANCKPKQVGEFTVTVCNKGKPPSSYEATFATDGGTPIVVSQPYEPSGTYNNQIELHGVNERYFEYRSDDFECSISFIVDRSSGKVVAESGCRNSRYCGAVKLPAPDECKVVFRCGDGSEDQTRWDSVTRSWCPKKEKPTSPK